MNLRHHRREAFWSQVCMVFESCDQSAGNGSPDVPDVTELNSPHKNSDSDSAMWMPTHANRYLAFFVYPVVCSALSSVDRRSLIFTIPSIGSLVGVPATVSATDLATRLAQRDPTQLENRLFNLPPSPQVYPDWLRKNNWIVQSRFAGFLLPSQSLSKEQVVSNPTVAGFQKCSIANLADIGKDVEYKWFIDPKTGYEDRVATLQSQVDAYLGYKAVQSVTYNPDRNPNRLSVNFVEYRTVNAERIELFCNAREQQQSAQESDTFVCAEYVRQVTFGTGSNYGVPRQVVTNYANFWTWNRDGSGNLLTAAYLDPQDPLYFSEPKKPVAIYSHQLSRQAV